MTDPAVAGGFLLRFGAMAVQLHLLGVLFMRLFRPDEANESTLVAEMPEDPPGSPPSLARILRRALRTGVPPFLGAAAGALVATSRDLAGVQTSNFAAWAVVFVGILAAYLYLTHRVRFFTEAVPTSLLFLVILALSESTVHYLTSGPFPSAGPFPVFLLGIELTRTGLVPADMGGFYERGSALLLAMVLIVLLAFPSIAAVHPRRIRTVVHAMFAGILLFLLVPFALTAHLLTLPTRARPFDPSELFTLLVFFAAGLVFFLVGIALLRKREEERRLLAEREAELAAQRFYDQQLQPVIASMRAQRHGHDNTKAYLAGLVRARDFEALDRFFAEGEARDERNAPVDASSMLRIRNAGLLGLLSAKAAAAHDAGVRFTLAVDADVGELPVPAYTLCEILGILLDNAVQAASEAPQKVVQLRIAPVGEGLSFRASNTFGTAPDLDRLGLKGYTTKGEGHGLGLSIVRARLRTLRDVQLNPSLEGGWFAQDLLLPGARRTEARVPEDASAVRESSDA